ncbi:hypothetical protein NLJ89_g9655 [Agrocybe chaxingu]|uniref:Uncharacterized protein n=1 Tax=Agrocybe chaxingu TaxID=84603 RepID=A0A9W8MSW2_9AGAR|nr:hypothetical protein NLJ89_g9655 [Agrocybe chaxingu]
MNSAGLPPVITPRIDFAVEWAQPFDNPGHDDANSIAADSNNSYEDAMLASEIEADNDIPNTEENKKIPKPPGEPGRPNSGGYNIESELRGWTPALIADVNQLVKRKADEHLEIGRSYSRQRPADITTVCLLIKKEFPVVNKYQNYWPIRDMLKLYLKYMAEKEKKEGAGVDMLLDTALEDTLKKGEAPGTIVVRGDLDELGLGSKGSIDTSIS